MLRCANSSVGMHSTFLSSVRTMAFLTIRDMKSVYRMESSPSLLICKL